MIDEVGSERFPRYLVYDIVKFEGIDVGMTDFSTRLVCIEREIVGARNTYIKTVKITLKMHFRFICMILTVKTPLFIHKVALLAISLLSIIMGCKPDRGLSL